MTKAYGTLIDGHKVKTKSQKLFYFFYMLRRLIYLSLALNYPNLPVSIQLISLILINIVWTIYLGLIDIHSSRRERRFELFNEFIVSMCFISLLTVTNWNGDPELQFLYSWMVIALIQLLVLVNFASIIVSGFKSIKSLAIKYYLKAVNYLQ